MMNIDLIQCYVFDFDGTLIDSNHVKRSAIYEISRQYGVSMASVEKGLDNPARPGRYQLFHNIFVLENKERFASAAIKDYTALTLQNISTSAPIKGALELLKTLKNKNIPCYINSATPEGPLVDIVKHMDWNQYFNGVFGRPASKVDNLKKISTELNLDESSILMVGDGSNDMAAANEFGCPFWAIIKDDGATLHGKTNDFHEDLRSLYELVKSK
jgi:phosphoglycolate phosphatase-like HAD superfamily hydrolase